MRRHRALLAEQIQMERKVTGSSRIFTGFTGFPTASFLNFLPRFPLQLLKFFCSVRLVLVVIVGGILTLGTLLLTLLVVLLVLELPLWVGGGGLPGLLYVQPDVL